MASLNPVEGITLSVFMNKANLQEMKTTVFCIKKKKVDSDWFRLDKSGQLDKAVEITDMLSKSRFKLLHHGYFSNSQEDLITKEKWFSIN